MNEERAGLVEREEKAGPPGPTQPEEIARLSADLATAQSALQIQFKRIAQLQTDLDALRARIEARSN